MLAPVGRSLGAGVSGLVNAFQPEVVVIGGGAMAAGELLLDSAREEVAARALPPPRERVRIVAAEFGGRGRACSARRILALEGGEV